MVVVHQCILLDQNGRHLILLQVLKSFTTGFAANHGPGAHRAVCEAPLKSGCPVSLYDRRPSDPGLSRPWVHVVEQPAEVIVHKAVCQTVPKAVCQTVRLQIF